MQSKIETLLNLAITAPSGDNCQPWRLSVIGSQIDLYNDPDADTSYYNYLQRASLLSHGSLLENISIAAPPLGLKPVIQLLPDVNNPDHVAKISLTEIPPLENELSPFITHRTTNRKRYTGGLLAEPQREVLSTGHADLTRVSIFLTNSRNEINALSDVISLSDRLVFEFQPLHNFLFEHIRWSDEEAIAYRDGLDIKTLELNAFDTLGFKLLKSWPLTRFACRFGAAKAIAANARKLCQSASVIGVIMGQGSPDPVAYIEGGRLMQRVWLQTTRMGLAFHPMTGISFLMQRVAENQAGELPELHQALIRDAVQTISSVSSINDPLVLGIFRVGDSAPPSARSLRKDYQQLRA